MRVNIAAVFGVLGEVAEERVRQEAKWGEQNHPDAVPGHRSLLPSAARARELYDRRHHSSEESWLDILVEEVAEAAEEAERGDAAALRKELIQVAAVAAAWAQAIDRRWEA